MQTIILKIMLSGCEINFEGSFSAYTHNSSRLLGFYTVEMLEDQVITFVNCID
jgi:hypothetical protein